MPARPADRQRLADLMERRRLELGLTWREVAEAGGLSYEVIRAVRNRDSQIRPLTKRGIAVALRWGPESVDLIMSGRDPVAASDEPGRRPALGARETAAAEPPEPRYGNRTLEYLSRTPGLTEAQCEVLIRLARTWVEPAAEAYQERRRA